MYICVCIITHIYKIHTSFLQFIPVHLVLVNKNSNRLAYHEHELHLHNHTLNFLTHAKNVEFSLMLLKCHHGISKYFNCY